MYNTSLTSRLFSHFLEVAKASCLVAMDVAKMCRWPGQDCAAIFRGKAAGRSFRCTAIYKSIVSDLSLSERDLDKCIVVRCGREAIYREQ